MNTLKEAVVTFAKMVLIFVGPFILVDLIIYIFS